MKNHFVFPYAGNKRNEIDDIYKYLKFDNITTIIEPYCGTSAMSFFIAQKHSMRFKYVLADNNPNLIKLYQILMDETGIDEMNEKMNKIIAEFNNYTDDTARKAYYKSLHGCGFAEWLFHNKYYAIKTGLYPMISHRKQIKTFDLRSFPIYDFLKTEQVDIQLSEAIDIISCYKDKAEVMMLLDPPYIASCNDFYKNPSMNIYEFLYHNNIDTFICRVFLILEDIWINQLLFGKNRIHAPYKKTYNSSKKKTTHIVISQT